MTQEEKLLLLKDLSARLPYNTKVFFSIIEEDEPVELSLSVIYCLGGIPLGQNDIVIKPYLRPMSSMTEEEKETYRIIIKSLLENSVTNYIATLYNFLNSKYLDYNGLIPLGLAIEVTEENNPYKE